jgi:hypothetical protein
MTDPLIPVKREGLDDIARSLLGEAPAPPADSPGQEDKKGKDVDLEKYVLLPKHDGYPDILISKDIIYPGRCWEQAWNLLGSDGSFMLTPRLFVDLLNLFRLRRTVYDGNGRLLDTIPASIAGYLDERTGSFSHGEWLDSIYRGTSRDPAPDKVDYHKLTTSGTLEARREPLMGYYNPVPQESIKSRASIHLSSWLDNANVHGLPKAQSRGTLTYVPPSIGCVPYFSRLEGWSIFNCGEATPDSESRWSIGVRPARVKK